ncbi:hypothetical protein [Aureispira sp. CCB-QB1]|uniref:hypothetical protein n=1 Tax=Aureispira sp. CCB-QB1 TaxID=1313421 RepID=UPI000697DA87|nr:hypothetical protein [Aureispira sp. CCB-QB1]
MNKLLFACLVSSLFLLTSCEKEALTPIQTEDYRDQLIGIYEGTITYEDIAKSNENKESTKAYDHLEHQQVEITKSSTQDNALVINGNVLNLVTQSVSNKNQYDDVFLYSAQDCSGKEAYLLTFSPANRQLILKYEHDRACSVGVLKQNSIFEGVKQ